LRVPEVAKLALFWLSQKQTLLIASKGSILAIRTSRRRMPANASLGEEK
jgi:hypothetical protein